MTQILYVVQKLLLISIFCTVSLICFAADNTNGQLGAPPGPTGQPQLQPQPWQIRRSDFAKAMRGAQAADEAARKTLDATVTEFEKRPFSRTPMENMEILGVFYVPKDGIEKSLVIVAANAVLGWYDALRFGSESGRAEILNNEGFLKKAFVLAGNENT